MTTQAKRLRSRCANPKCGKQVRHARSTWKTCSERCKKAVYRANQRAADQLAAEAKAAAEAAERIQRMVRKVKANKDAAAERQREEAIAREHDQQSEQPARKRPDLTRPDYPIEVTLPDRPRRNLMTPLTDAQLWPR